MRRITRYFSLVSLRSLVEVFWRDMVLMNLIKSDIEFYCHFPTLLDKIVKYEKNIVVI